MYPGMLLPRILIIIKLVVISNSFNIYEPARIQGWNYFGYTWMESKPSVVFRKPMAAMVDLTNDLGVAILQDYSYSRSNFAFSPYGVASVLVVLYEGARGESARQIHRAVKFPWDRDITRVGFRDIHRHLRSYFSHEGYLSGITLSKEGSTLKPEYKRILRFYGYDVDVDSFEKATDSPPLPATEKIPPRPSSTIRDEVTTAAGNDITTTIEMDSEVTTIATTVVNSGGTSTSSNDETTTTLNTMEGTSTVASDAEITPVTEASEMKTQEVTTDSFTEIPTALLDIETEEHINSTEFATEDSSTTDSFNGESEVFVTTATEPETSTNDVEEITITDQTDPTEGVNSVQEPKMKENLANAKVNEKRNIESFDNGMLIPDTSSSGRLPLFDARSSSAHGVPEEKNVVGDPRETESLLGKWPEVKGSLIAEGDRVKWEPKTLDQLLADLMNSTNGTRTITRTKRLAAAKYYRNRRKSSDFYVPYEKKHSEKGTKHPSKQKITALDFETCAQLKRGHSTKEKRTISDFVKLPAVTDLSLQLQNGMFDSHVSKNTDLYRALPKFLFLVDGAIDTPVPMMTYSNVFPFAYIPRLHCKALEFPLDLVEINIAISYLSKVLEPSIRDFSLSDMLTRTIFHLSSLVHDERYKLLILLPVERRGLRQLIYDLGFYPLREVIDVLRPARVKAMVPTFMVEGFVILTPTLQKLGIWDVFDSRRSDLSGMTTDPELYVRNIEQSVTVVIRNYVEILDIQTRTMAARDVDEDFTASHPFLYFVLDTTTNVALMAGQMLDPLNSRIY